MKGSICDRSRRQTHSCDVTTISGIISYYFLLLPCVVGGVKDVCHVITSSFRNRSNYDISCSDDYENLPVFEDCTPKDLCGRTITDKVVSYDEAHRLLQIAKQGFSHGGSDGSASILDLHCGALSVKHEFVNIYKYLDPETLSKTFRKEDFEFYSTIINRVHDFITEEYGINRTRVHLTHPTFFSRITNASATSRVQEYWHKHIDKARYPSFDYTSLLYLSDYGTDFTGGRFFFDEAEQMVVEPRMGRLSFFTSGSENPHHVEKIKSGIRYAATISFTCNSKDAIEHPKMKEF